MTTSGLLFAAGLLYKLGQEERVLAEHFGTAYDAHKQQVKGCVPFIW